MNLKGPKMGLERLLLVTFLILSLTWSDIDFIYISPILLCYQVQLRNLNNSFINYQYLKKTHSHQVLVLQSIPYSKFN